MKNRGLFETRFREAMQTLGLKQIQVAGMTGRSKASISQYLSGDQVPSETAQRDIARSLGLPEDYFSRPDDEDRSPAAPCPPRRRGSIRRLSVKEAAGALGIDRVVLSKGLRQGVFPWGYGIKTTERSWKYVINADRFAAIEGVEI
jgi:DNA-binding helix-turn-helix protein